MHWIDLTIIVLYMGACVLLGSWVGLKDLLKSKTASSDLDQEPSSSPDGGKRSSGLRSYFLGERNVPFWAILISIVATETSTVTFLSVPGKAYDRGNFLFLQLAIGYIIGRFLVAQILLPMYFRKEIYSAYEVLGDRFGAATKGLASLLFLGMRTVGDGIRLFLTATIILSFTDLELETCILILGFCTIVYTAVGGMKAVIWTDVLQFIVYIAGAILALVLLLKSSNGLSAITSQPGLLRFFDFSFSLTNPWNAWAGILGGAMIAMATHGADQLMVQRYLSARSQKQASLALVTSGFVVFAQFALFLLIGAALTPYFLSRMQQGSGIPDRDMAFLGFLSSDGMPTGAKGLIIASLFAAAMSTLSSSLNSSAASTLNDLILPLRRRFKSAKSEESVNFVQWSQNLCVFWGIAQIGVAMSIGVLNPKKQAIDMVLEVAAMSAGLLLGLFLAGLWLKRAGQLASLVGLAAGAATVIYMKIFTNLAFPWYALVGASSVLLVTAVVGLVLPRSQAASKQALTDEC